MITTILLFVIPKFIDMLKNPYNLFQNSGIGSPGTISEAIVGYTGSNEYKRGRNWVISSILEGQ